MDTISKISPYWEVAKLNEIKTEKEASEAFEAMFVNTLLKEVRKNMPDGLFNSSFSSKMYNDMFDMQIAQVIASSDQLKLGEYIEEAAKAYQHHSDSSHLAQSDENIVDSKE